MTAAAVPAVEILPSEGAGAKSLTAYRAMHAAYRVRDWREILRLGDNEIAAAGGLHPVGAMWYAQALLFTGNEADAFRWGGTAVNTTPESQPFALAAVWIAYGMLCCRVGLWTDAEQAFRAALAIELPDPTTDDEREGWDTRATLLIVLSENWRDGWQTLERRKMRLLPSAEVVAPHGFWTGEGPCAVMQEGGLGDIVMFARWLPHVYERIGEPVPFYGDPKVKRWIEGLGVPIRWMTNADIPVDRPVARMMSLPWIFGNTGAADLPAPLVAWHLPLERPMLRRAHREFGVGATHRIGVVWRGAAKHWQDFERSIPRECFAGMLQPIKGVEFVNCCHGEAVPPDAPFGPVIFRDVSDLADRLATCDALVSVDTAPVHVAAALGVPTLVLSHSTPDLRWRWPDNFVRSPWGASVTTFKRNHWLDFDGHVARARQALLCFLDSGDWK